MPETSGEARRLDAKARTRKGSENILAVERVGGSKQIPDSERYSRHLVLASYSSVPSRRKVYVLEVPPKRMHRRNRRQCCGLRAQGAWAQANRLKSTRAGQVLLFWIQASFGPSQQ